MILQQSEVISGVLSGFKEIKGIRFLRIMCLIGIGGSLVFGSGLIFLVSNQKELIWDRGLILALCVIGYIWGGMPDLNKKGYSMYVYVLFYLFSIQTIVGVYLNDFHPAHIVVSIITLQMISLSFRLRTDALVYLGICVGIFLIALLYNVNLNFRESTLTLFIVMMCAGCNLILIWFKTDFIDNLKLNRDLLRSLVNKTENSIFVTSTTGIILDCNSRASEMFGYARDEMVNFDFRMLRIHSLKEEEIIGGLGALERNKFWNSETELRRQDGSSFHSFLSIAMVQRKEQRFFVYRVRDNSAVKTFETELLLAKENAESASASRGQFLATMSHEIRTPLNGVIGMASLLDQTDLDVRQKEYVDTIQKSGQSLMVLINDILDYSKMDNGRLALQAEETHVPDAVYEVCDLLRSHSEVKGVRLELSVDPDIPQWVQTDVSRLKQVLLNLVGNAIKFTDRGFVKVECRVASLYLDQVSLRFSVRDSGIGVPIDKQNLLFKPFSQIAVDGGKKYGGTGLGLAISRQIVDLLGGEMQLDSQEGKGAEFSFTIQAKVMQRLARPEATGSAQDMLQEHSEKLSSLKILIAEDNLINQNVLLYMLETIGLKADVVSNGKEVIRQMALKRYDIIYMDVQMPEMDGVLATAWIRAHSKYQPYIICMTANSFGEEKERCIGAGMDEFIPKPFDLGKILQSLRKWILACTGDSERAA